ncbi:MAG: proton-conducting transporter membrane subunit [Aquihabitans sp.]
MNAFPALLVLLPLFAAALSIGIGWSRNAQRLVSLATLSGLVGLSVALVVAVDRDGPIAVQAGGWVAPVGITLVADRLSAGLLLVSAVTLLAVLVYSIGAGGVEREFRSFHPLYLILGGGVSLSFLTGDLFNLFVAFEVTLMASFVLITLGGAAEQVRKGMTYVVLNLVASTLFLFLLAFVYGSTGTVNLADLGSKVAELPDGLRAALAVMLVVVFGMKAAVFPLFNWLPDSYPTAPIAITAVFAGLLTKVGVYALIRTTTVVLPSGSRPGTLLLWVAGLTMVIGVFGAIVQTDIKRLLSFHIVSQIGYMVMGLGLFTVAGVAGAMLFVIHQIVVKAALFLVGGLVERRRGTGDLGYLSGLATSEPLIAVLFLIPALSLAGIPPSSGFVAKLALVQSGLAAGAGAVVAVSLAVSLLTLFSMTKIWANGFWGPKIEAATPTGAAVAPEADPRGYALMVAGTAILVVGSLVVAVAAGPIHAYCQRAAQDLIESSVYVDAVLGR